MVAWQHAETTRNGVHQAASAVLQDLGYIRFILMRSDLIGVRTA